MFGVAVLASVFSANGSYQTGQAFVAGMTPALQLGAVVVALGAAAAFAIGGRVRVTSSEPATSPTGAAASA